MNGCKMFIFACLYELRSVVKIWQRFKNYKWQILTEKLIEWTKKKKNNVEKV